MATTSEATRKMSGGNTDQGQPESKDYKARLSHYNDVLEQLFFDESTKSMKVEELRNKFFKLIDETDSDLEIHRETVKRSSHKLKLEETKGDLIRVTEKLESKERELSRLYEKCDEDRQRHNEEIEMIETKTTKAYNRKTVKDTRSLKADLFESIDEMEKELVEKIELFLLKLRTSTEEKFTELVEKWTTESETFQGRWSREVNTGGMGEEVERYATILGIKRVVKKGSSTTGTQNEPVVESDKPKEGKFDLSKKKEERKNRKPGRQENQQENDEPEEGNNQGEGSPKDGEKPKGFLGRLADVQSWGTKDKGANN